MPTLRAERADDPAFTAVRGFAAFWVFFYHAWVFAGPQLLAVPLGFVSLDVTWLASMGWAGVDIFYVLSGFLLWGVFDDWASRRGEALPLAHYAERRALRILPPWYGQIAIIAVIGWTTGWIARPSAADVAWNVVLLQGWLPDRQQAINPVSWTLSIEMQFYVLLPLLAWLVRRTGWGAVFALGFATTVAWRYGALQVLAHESVRIRVWGIEQLPGRIDQFVCGMYAHHLARMPGGFGAALRTRVLACAWLHRPLLWLGPVTLAALSARMHFGGLFLRYWDGDPWLYVWHLLASVGVAASLFALAIRPSRDHSAPITARERLLVGFGTVSYSFYLWHELLLQWLQPVSLRLAGGAGGTPVALVVTLGLGFASALAVAVVSYAVLERPFLRTRARLREM